MTHDNGVPDSISAAQLLELAKAARAASGGPPIGDALPVLPLADPEGGVLDLTIAVEQIILRAGGVNFLQMLHAAAFLLDACKDGLDDELTNLSHKAAAAETPRECEVLNRVQSRLLTDLAAMEHCLVVLGRILEPLTARTLEVRDVAYRLRGGKREFVGRPALVSDETLQALGVSVPDFDKYFHARLSEGDFSS